MTSRRSSFRTHTAAVAEGDDDVAPPLSPLSSSAKPPPATFRHHKLAAATTLLLGLAVWLLVSDRRSDDTLQELLQAGPTVRAASSQQQQQEAPTDAIKAATTPLHLPKAAATESSSSGAGSGGKRLAVLVAGSFLRYSVSSFLQNVARPVTEQGDQVDYFVVLTRDNAPAYRSESGYMNHLTWDPLFGNNNKPMPSAQQIQPTLQGQLDGIPGATLRYAQIVNQVQIDNVPQVVAQRNQARAQYPDDADADLRFPIWDTRPKAQARTANANRNMLRLFFSQQLLWRKLLQVEQKLGLPYDYVLVMRDDAEWLQPFHLNALLQLNVTADVFVPSCDARQPPLHPLELNDHIALAKRKASNAAKLDAAAFFGDYFSVLFQSNLTQACSERVPNDIKFSKGGAATRGCNSEMLLQFALQRAGLQVQAVGQGYLPMQRAARVNTKGGTTTTCFHKYCQSVDRPLPDYGLEKCSALKDFA